MKEPNTPNLCSDNETEQLKLGFSDYQPMLEYELTSARETIPKIVEAGRSLIFWLSEVGVVCDQVFSLIEDLCPEEDVNFFDLIRKEVSLDREGIVKAIKLGSYDSVALETALNQFLGESTDLIVRILQDQNGSDSLLGLSSPFAIKNSSQSTNN